MMAAGKPRPSSLRRAEEREFLPAALEELESPPSPLGRGLAFGFGAHLGGG